MGGEGLYLEIVPRTSYHYAALLLEKTSYAISFHTRLYVVRKGYHIIALLLFLPPLLLEPQLLAIALAVAFAMLLAVETVRVGGVPVISQRLTGFMTTFTDARDGGVIFVTHLALLTGMAGPIWISVLGKKEGQPISGTALAGLLVLGEVTIE